MTSNNTPPCDREYDFALIVDGVPELTEDVMDALFRAGCEDATPSMQRGLLYMEFSRTGASLKDAILSALRNVNQAGISARVLRVDACNLVTESEIGRRIGRSRQLVNQYISGVRGPGRFPPPECYLREQSPLWAWCAVSYWLVQNNLLRPEDHWDAEAVYAINAALERHHWPNQELLASIEREVDGIA